MQGLAEFRSDITPDSLILFLISDVPLLAVMLKKGLCGIHMVWFGTKTVFWGLCIIFFVIEKKEGDAVRQTRAMADATVLITETCVATAVAHILHIF